MNPKVLVAIVATITTLIIAGMWTIAVPQSANANQAMARATGKPCGSCHVNPAGGGKLTEDGEKYKKTLK